MRTSSGTARAPGMSSGYIEWLKVMSLIVRVWQNVVHWRREWQTTSVFLPWEPHEQYEKAKRHNTERWTPQVGRCPIYYWGRAEKWLQKEWRGWAKVGKKPSHNKTLSSNNTRDDNNNFILVIQHCFMVLKHHKKIDKL